VPLGIDFVDTVTLKTAEGRRLRLRRDNILSIQTSGVSIMPDGLEQAMSVEDFRDLLAYLLTLR
jgi:putative heme-binding domain-containing protein